MDTLKSKPQDSELPFVSASELRRFPKTNFFLSTKF